MFWQWDQYSGGIVAPKTYTINIGNVFVSRKKEWKTNIFKLPVGGGWPQNIFKNQFLNTFCWCCVDCLRGFQNINDYVGVLNFPNHIQLPTKVFKNHRFSRIRRVWPPTETAQSLDRTDNSLLIFFHAVFGDVDVIMIIWVYWNMFQIISIFLCILWINSFVNLCGFVLAGKVRVWPPTETAQSLDRTETNYVTPPRQHNESKLHLVESESWSL